MSKPEKERRIMERRELVDCVGCSHVKVNDVAMKIYGALLFMIAASLGTISWNTFQIKAENIKQTAASTAMTQQMGWMNIKFGMLAAQIQINTASSNEARRKLGLPEKPIVHFEGPGPLDD